MKEIFAVPIIDKIDVADIRQLVSEFTHANCKIVLTGNDILTRKDVKLPPIIQTVKKEPFFGAKY